MVVLKTVLFHYLIGGKMGKGGAGKIQLDQEEVLQTLRYVAKGANTPAAIMKLSESPKSAVSGRLNILIRARFVRSEENEEDRRFKFFIPDYNGLQRAFVKLVKSRCNRRVREIQRMGAGKEELAALEEPAKCLQKFYPVFQNFNESQLGKSLFKALINYELENKEDFVASINDVFERIILTYSGLAGKIPANMGRFAKERLEAVAVCCDVAGKFNVFPLEELACEYLKQNAEK